MFDCCAERDVDVCRWCESNKSTDSDPASQEGKGATVFSFVREWSYTTERICVSGLFFCEMLGKDSLINFYALFYSKSKSANQDPKRVDSCLVTTDSQKWSELPFVVLFSEI